LFVVPTNPILTTGQAFFGWLLRVVQQLEHEPAKAGHTRLCIFLLLSLTTSPDHMLLSTLLFRVAENILIALLLLRTVRPDYAKGTAAGDHHRIAEYISKTLKCGAVN
jgi:hypothetical protein